MRVSVRKKEKEKGDKESLGLDPFLKDKLVECAIASGAKNRPLLGGPCLSGSKHNGHATHPIELPCCHFKDETCLDRVVHSRAFIRCMSAAE